jgi:hypothetical protein
VASSPSSENSSDDSDARSEVYSPFTRVFASVIANQEPNNFPSLQALNEAADSDEARDRAARDRAARDRAARDRAERDREARDRATGGESSRQNTRDSPLVNGNGNEVHQESTSSASSDNETMRSRLLGDGIRPVLRIGVNVSLPDSDHDPVPLDDFLPSPNRAPPLPGPLTVTDLILSKRKEYLAGIHKQEARQRRRRRMQARRCQERVGLGSNESSEGVSGIGLGGAILNGCGLGNNGDETSSSSDSEEEEDRMFRLPDRVRTHHRQHKNLERISRLRFLRSQVEGEDNSATAFTSNVRAGNSTSDGDPDVVVDGVIGLPEHPSSPYGMLCDALMVARETGTEVTDFGVHVDNVPLASSSRQTTSGDRDSTGMGKAGAEAGHDRTSVGNERIDMGKDRTSEAPSRTEDDAASTDIRTNGAAERGVGVGAESGGGTEQEPMASTSSEQGGDGTWQHFKRFKKSVEKARRNYRKRKHPEDT